MVRVGLVLIVIHSFQQSDDQVIDCSDKCLAVEELHFEGIHLEEHYQAVIGSDLLDHHSGCLALYVNLLVGLWPTFCVVSLYLSILWVTYIIHAYLLFTLYIYSLRVL